MAMMVGNRVIDPRNTTATRHGVIIEVIRNPACLMRTLVIAWEDPVPVLEEVPELEFGPLED